jgi:hypothetical protein
MRERGIASSLAALHSYRQYALRAEVVSSWKQVSLISEQVLAWPLNHSNIYENSRRTDAIPSRSVSVLLRRTRNWRWPHNKGCRVGNHPVVLHNREDERSRRQWIGKRCRFMLAALSSWPETGAKTPPGTSIFLDWTSSAQRSRGQDLIPDRPAGLTRVRWGWARVACAKAAVTAEALPRASPAAGGEGPRRRRAASGSRKRLRRSASRRSSPGRGDLPPPAPAAGAGIAPAPARASVCLRRRAPPA